MEKKVSRLKRARRGRAKIRELKVMRLSVHRTPRHIYAQVLDDASHVVAVASTVQKDVAEGLKFTGNVDAAKAVGKAIAERARAKGVTQVAFAIRFQVPRARQGAGGRGTRARARVLSPAAQRS